VHGAAGKECHVPNGGLRHWGGEFMAILWQICGKFIWQFALFEHEQ